MDGFLFVTFWYGNLGKINVDELLIGYIRWTEDELMKRGFVSIIIK